MRGREEEERDSGAEQDTRRGGGIENTECLGRMEMKRMYLVREGRSCQNQADRMSHNRKCGDKDLSK